MPAPVLHGIFAIQCVVILLLLALEPEFDYVASLFVGVSFQAALVFSPRVRWKWVSGLVFLTGASLMISLGPLRGLGLALTPMAVEISLSALAVVGQELEAARTTSQDIVRDLEATHAQLQRYAAEVRDLAVVEERNRLARQLHDSVSQAMFSIALVARSAQIIGEKDPEGVREQIHQLQELTQDALARMRGFITELRPKPE